MAEEHRCHAPRLCVNNCGFFGSPATQDLCSKCYRDLQLQQQQQSSAKHALNQSLTAAVGTATTTTTTTTTATDVPSSSSSSTSSSNSWPAGDLVDLRINHTVVIDQLNCKKGEVKEEPGAVVQGTAHQKQQQERQQTNRCLTCRKRVGLTGFKCRCGLTFCGTHRYPENHGCTFDFKALGKEQIAKENPFVKAEKLVEKI